MGVTSLSRNTYKGGPAVNLDLGASLDLQSAESLAEMLREAVSANLPVVVDASAVERLSTGVIQLFLAADKALAGSGCEFALNNPSGSFMAAFADCGITPDKMGWTLVSEGADG